MKNTQFIVRNPEQLDIHFYSSYDENFLLNKAETLMAAIKAPGEFEQLASKSFETNIPRNKRFFDSLRAEIYFSEFHQFESFFALLIALFQGQPHWLYLTTYQTKEIKDKVTAFINGDISKLTNNLLKTSEELVNIGLYWEILPSDEDKLKNWLTNVQNVIWLLERMARKYLKAVEYNGYKHGLRVMTGATSLTFHPDESPNKAFGFQSDDSVIFLETVDKGEGGLTVYKTVKHFNIEESIRHLFYMNLMAKTIKSTRLARLKNLPDAEINTFFNLNREELINFSKTTQWSFSS